MYNSLGKISPRMDSRFEGSLHESTEPLHEKSPCRPARPTISNVVDHVQKCVYRKNTGREPLGRVLIIKSSSCM